MPTEPTARHAAAHDGESPNAVALVDLHCHGALGAEFGLTTDGTRLAAAHHHSRRTDRVVASLVTAAPDELARQVGLLAPLVADGTLAGIHLEGPFLADGRRGAHDPRWLVAPDPGLVRRLVEVAAAAGAPRAIVQWTLAPELPGAMNVIDVLAAHRIRPAFGHTDCTAAEFTAAVCRAGDAFGAPPLATHLFNGMPLLHHRSGGPVAAALTLAAREELIVELVADGVHLAPEVVRMVFELVGPKAIALVSDAMSGTGLGDGDYVLGGQAVTVRHGVVRLRDGGVIAGSVATLADCVAWTIDQAGVAAADAICAASTTPGILIR